MPPVTTKKPACALDDPEDKILAQMEDAERKAWEALGGYKFWMFGYHAGRWINYNNLLAQKQPNPFKDTVHLARTKLENRESKAA